MSILYVAENGAVIGIEGGYYIVRQKNGLERRIPSETLEAVTIFGSADITTPCIKKFLADGVSVNYFSSNGTYFGKLSSTRHIKAERLKKQIYVSDNPKFCLQIGQSIISSKIHNQIVLLRRYNKNNDAKVNSFIRDMNILERKVKLSSSIEMLMGFEGLAARHYFNALPLIVNDDFKFSGRTRQPPKDAFNSMLSLGYTILLYEIYAEIDNRGFSPYIGIIHSDRNGHPALASDLMEEWRSVVVDSVVMSLVQGGEISIEQFTVDNDTGGILMTKGSMKTFVNKMEKKFKSENSYLTAGGEKTSIRRCFYLQTVDFMKAVLNEDPSIYRPVRIR